MRLGSDMNHRTNYLPILMYHAIWSSADGSIPQTSSIEHAVEARDFGDQLDAIVYGGYNTITLDDLERPFSVDKPLLITFDDGHESDLTIAAPQLARRDLQAIFFVIWSYLGQPGYLTRDQVVELRRQGFEIGSHGLNHTRLTQVSPAEASNEVLESKRRLEDLLQEPIAGLALPFGHYNDAVLHAAWAAGYRRVMTSDFKVANREHRIMPRMGPMAYHTLKDFKWMLEATPAAAIRHRKIEALGERLRRFVNLGEALLMRAQNSASTKN
ncbi:MAG TPA: polysaccharide deacetylase family protein [Methylomirabilota bacterium]|nr:polysaccharide deacetylase family protein [Methylomirabilota bacterium]